MSSIEGVGGEVIQFFIFLGIIIICLLLWLSTRVRSTDEPFFSTVYVLERRYERNAIEDEHNRLSNFVDRSNESEPLGPSTSDSSDNRPSVTINQSTSNEIASISNCEENMPTNTDNADVNPSCSGESELRKRSSISVKTGSQNISVNENAEIKPECTLAQDTVINEAESNIKVRLKYLNDDSREVEGLLHERLSDFKRRNFPDEITANKLIRLIFNGRVLRDDNVSLQNHGLFNDCVVHCLIANEKPQPPSNTEQQQPTQNFSQNNEQTTTPEWNLSKLLVFIVVGILSLTWYCRYQFAALFTFTSTSFLLGLTVIFLCSMFGTFYVDSVPINNAG